MLQATLGQSGLSDAPDQPLRLLRATHARFRSQRDGQVFHKGKNSDSAKAEESKDCSVTARDKGATASALNIAAEPPLTRSSHPRSERSPRGAASRSLFCKGNGPPDSLSRAH